MRSATLNTAAMKSCPICGWRDIATQTVYGGQRIPACETCAVRERKPAAPKNGDEIRARVIRFVVGNPGLNIRGICAYLEVGECEHEAVSTALRRAVRDGYLVRGPGGRNSRTFHPGPRRWQQGANRKNRRAA